MIGRRGTAPCGHPGEAIIGHYYRCSVGCDAPGAGAASDGVPESITSDPSTSPICRKCGGDAIITYHALGVAGNTWHVCATCHLTWSTP